MSPDQHQQTANQRDPSFRWTLILKVAAALLLLNFLTSFDNVWPTPLIKPDARVGPEFVALWVLLLAWVALFKRVGSFALAALTGLYLLVVIGRYADVTVPALFGRELNLYWDGHQIPKFLEVASQTLAGWQIAGILIAIILGAWFFIWLIRACISTLAKHAVPYALRSPIALVITVFWMGMVAGNLMKVEATWPYISRPVVPIYFRQADLLLTAFLPSRLAKVLPASPPLTSDLAALNGAEVKMLFLESYGATTYEHPEIVKVIDPVRVSFEQAANQQGRTVLSAFVRAATFGGASELSHMSVLSGIDLTDPLRHDLLLTTDRKTMIDTFEAAGYRTIGLYPAMSWEWPEKSFYDFDHYQDAPSLSYQGPKFGLWWLPDQFVMARIDEMYPPSMTDKPRFILYPTITSHIPFRPTPPYQPDWSRVTSDKPYDDDETATALADKIDWTNLFPPYIKTIEYTFKWLAGYEAIDQPRENVLILIGDHQPASSVTGPNASWDVPVHIVTSNEVLLDRLRAAGFTDGVNPRRQSLGRINVLNQILLNASNSTTTKIADATDRTAPTQ